MENFNSRRITNIGIMTALYVALTLLCSGLSYGQIQFRFSEALMLLCFFNKDYIISLSLGCFTANLFSPLGMIDVAFGTAATLIAAILIYATRKKLNLYTVSLFPVISNGIIIAIELKLVYDMPLLASMAWVALGEFICVTVFGCIIVKLLSKNKQFMKLITFGTSQSES